MTDGKSKTTPPLADIRILDLSTVVAGPFGSGLLATLGADVIRVVPPAALHSGEPDPQAGLGLSDGFYYALQRGKRSLSLDLKSPRGLELFHELVRKSDVVYDNFRPGVLGRLGIDYLSLARINPGIISCSLSGYGQTGPWSEVAAYDITIQALAGGMSITGNGGADDVPCRWGVPVGDLAGSMYAAIGVLATLEERDRTGKGQMIDIALLDCQLALNTYRVPQAFGAGAEFSSGAPRRGGAGTVPYGPFLCGDGQWIAIGVASNFWQGFCAALKRPDLLDEPNFRTLKDRQANQAELDAVLERIFAAQDSETWAARLTVEGVPNGRVNSIGQAFTDAQSKARDMIETIEDRWGRSVPVSGSPLKFDRTPLQARPAPRDPATDTNEILTRELGLSESEIHQLVTNGVVAPLDGMTGGAR